MNVKRLFITLTLFLILSILPAGAVMASTNANPAESASPLACVPGPHSGTITADEEWCLADSPHLLIGDVTVANGATLTIEAGVVVQGNANVRLQVNGHLDAVGTPAQPITFTSSSGATDGWEGLYFYGIGDNQGTGHLRHAAVYYGGDSVQYANIYAYNVTDGQVVIESSQVISVSRSGTDYGLRASGSHVVISDTLFADNGNSTGDYGLYADGSSAITVTDSTFQDNAGYGLYLNSSQADLTCATVFSNGNDGIRLTGAATTFSSLSSAIYDNAGLGLNNTTGATVDATYNRWGDPSGPTHASNPGGSGEKISDDVIFDPWLTWQQCVCDLAITKTDDPDPVMAGDTLTCTLAIANNGPGDATGVVVSDTLPESMTFVSSTPDCNESDGVVTCDLGDLARESSAIVTLIVTVDPEARGVHTNAAAIAGDQTDYDSTNSASTETTTVKGEADLSVAKSDSHDPVTAGSLLTYTLTVANHGPTAALGATLTDTLPLGVSFEAASAGCDHAAGVVTCDLGDLALNDTAVVTLTVAVDPATRGTITNTAVVASSDVDPNPENDEATESTMVTGEADLSVAKTDSADPATAGATLGYTLTVANDGPSEATGVTLTDTLPAETAFEAASAGCDHAAGVVTCDLGALAPNDGATVTVTVTVDPAAQGTITNTASVGAVEFDPNPENDTAVATTFVQSACIEVDTVEIAGPATGAPNTALIFEAAAAPAGATLPITYTWQASHQTPVVHVDGLSDAVIFNWDAAGTRAIAATAANACGLVSDTHTITITEPASPAPVV